MAQTWAFVKAVNNIPASSTGTTVAAVFGSAVGAGNLLVASCCWGTGTLVPSFSDSVNGSWGASVFTQNDGPASESIATGHFPNSASGTPTVTATVPSSNFRGIICSEYSGLQTSPLDGNIANANASGTDNPNSGNTGAVAAADDMVYGFCIEDNAGTSTVRGTPNGSADVTVHTGQNPAIVNNVSIAAGDKDGPASGVTSVTFNINPPLGVAQCLQCVTFKQAVTSTGGLEWKQPTSQPIRQYEDRRQQLRSIVAAPAAVHQGVTLQATHPVPLVTRHYERRYYLYDPNRLLPGGGNVGPDAQYDGATNQQTAPIPPVTTNPSSKYYLPDPNRLVSTNAGPEPQFDGATVQPWFIYRPSQPMFAYYVRDTNRYVLGGGNMGPDAQLDGATKQQTYAFPNWAQVDPRYYLRSPWAPPALPIDVVVGPVPQLYVFPLSQPVPWYYLRDTNRYVLGGGNMGPDPQLDGATLQQTYVFPLLSQVDARYYARRPWGAPTLPIDVATAVTPQLYVFGLTQPELRWWRRQDPNVLASAIGAAAQFTGATKQSTDPIPPVTTRPDAWFGPLSPAALDLRRMTGPRPQLDGPAPQPWFLYPLSQPEASRYAMRESARRLSGPAPQLAGATVQDWFLYPVAQPDLRRVTWPDINRYARIGPTPQSTGATSQQTYIFPVRQPDFRHYVRVTPAGPWTPVLGFISPAGQTFIFPPSQPEMRAYIARELARRGIGPASFIWLPQGDEGRLPDNEYLATLIVLSPRQTITSLDADRDLDVLITQSLRLL